MIFGQLKNQYFLDVFLLIFCMIFVSLQRTLINVNRNRECGWKTLGEFLQKAETSKLFVFLGVTDESLETNPINVRRILNELILKLGLLRGLKSPNSVTKFYQPLWYWSNLEIKLITRARFTV